MCITDVVFINSSMVAKMFSTAIDKNNIMTTVHRVTIIV